MRYNSDKFIEFEILKEKYRNNITMNHYYKKKGTVHSQIISCGKNLPAATYEETKGELKRQNYAHRYQRQENIFPIT